MSTIKVRLLIRVISLVCCLAFLGCGGTQNFLQQSGADHKQVEKMNWSDEPSARDTNWTTYMDLEH
jgi:hypothetical protein